MNGEIFSNPKTIHFLRQTDCLSFAAQYFNDGFDFFNPKLYNLKNIDARAACEFPITYYIASLLYVIFGKHLVILKLVHLIILYIGIYYVYKLSNLILKSTIISILLSLFLFTSTVFNYYSFNYLPDTPALGLCFIGMYHIIKYFSIDKKSHLIIGFLFFTLAGLIKVTYTIYPISIIIFALYTFLIKNRIQISKLQSRRIIHFGWLSILIVFLWNAYIIYYNFVYESQSFNTKPMPLWNMNKDELIEVWDIMVNYWNSEYFAHTSMITVAFMLLIQIIFNKKADKRLLAITSISFLGCLSYFILFYSQFKDHDYYILVFFPLLILILINGMKVLFSIVKSFNIKMKNVSIIFFALIVIYGIRYSSLQLTRRYNLQPDDVSLTSLQIESKIKEINKLNIPNKARFIVAPDPTQNGGLFFFK